MAEPILDLQWGKVNWVDYEHNWREKDAEYLQARSILRFHNDTERDAGVPPTAYGSVVYNETSDRLELRSKTGTWVRVNPLPQSLVVTADSPTEVAISHQASAGKGITYTPNDIRITGPLNILNDTVRITAAGILIGPDANKATISYDGTSVLGDKPFKIPKIDLTSGTGTVVDATGKEIKTGTLTVDQTATINNLSLTSTLTGGVINGTSGTIGGVNMATNKVTASAGFLSQGAQFRGDGTRAIIEYPGKAATIVVADRVTLDGDMVDLQADLMVRNQAISWYDSGGTKRGDYAVSVYAAADPGAGNFPEGTIWFS